jgi:acyl-coenzyme A thioesterase PaaI-like protein
MRRLHARHAIRHFSASPSSFIDHARTHGVQSLLGPFRFNPGHFDECLKDLHILKLSADGVECTLKVATRLGNSYGTLHGGAVASLIDVVGTLVRAQARAQPHSR